MADKSIKTRIQLKRGTQADWDAATTAGFKPLEGEQIFYTDLNKIKVGKYQAGTTEEQKKSANHTDYLMLLSELDFLNADYINTEVTSQINTLISSGTDDPSVSTASQYYFKYN